MAISSMLKNFYESHPYPDKCSINSLFRFYKIDLDRVGYLRHLFTERKLYHPLPSQFNDPFECKPHFSFPKKAKKILAIRQHFIKLFRGKGDNRRVAEEKVSTIMENPTLLQTRIFHSAQNAYGALRICSFTTRKDNLLFWSHYADSHRGFCVEFDATKPPISNAYKVDYKDDYPEVVYPIPHDSTGFTPALVKSKFWEKEEEFRTIFFPGAEPQLSNDGESLILSGNEIKNVYLGSEIDEKNKNLIIDLVRNGNFNPVIWSTSLSKSTFRLEFAQIG